jgi:DNA (cytosine-5)-methyltransferase 1
MITNNTYKAVELFAGIGGFRLACNNLNIETIWANDIDPTAIKVYKSNFGKDSIVEGDIWNLIESVPNHDLLTGGFPCQPFSKAGKKQGVQDYRGTLFEAIVKILSIQRPKYFVLENVSSLLCLENGKNFQAILSALASLNYKIEWKVFNALEFGLPQNRERIVIVGSRDAMYNESYFVSKEILLQSSISVLSKITSLDEWNIINRDKLFFGTWGMAYGDRYISCDIPCAKNIHKLTLKSILQNEVNEYFDFTEETEERIKNSVFVNRFFNGVQILYNQAGGARMGYSIFGVDGIAPTLTASSSRHYERYKIGNMYRRLTNVEYARLQGFPDNHCNAVSIYKQYKLYGNAVPHQIVQYVIEKLINEEKTEINYPKQTLF